MSEETKKNIWIFHHYATPPTMSGLTRAYDFSKQLIKEGYKCTIFSSSYLHYSSEQIITDNSFYKELVFKKVPFIFVKTTKYKNSKLLRILNILNFYLNLLNISKTHLRTSAKPDVIIGSSAHPLAAIASIKLGKKYGCTSIVEIRDLWPESFVAYGIINKKSFLFRLLHMGEKWIYKKADKIIFTMEGGKDYIKEQGWDNDKGGPINLSKVHHINNGVDLEKFNYNKKHYQLDDEDLNNPNTFKVVYTGSIRLVNDVKSIVDTALELKNIGITDIKFLIYGDGNDRVSLEKYCRENGLDNIVFKGFVDKKNIPYILSKSDLNLLHFKQSKIKKYGASLNKMFEYFASGKPTLSDCEFGYDLIKKYECGVTVDSVDPKTLANEIVKFKEYDATKYNQYCINALKAADDYDFKALTYKLIDIIEGDTGKKN